MLPSFAILQNWIKFSANNVLKITSPEYIASDRLRMSGYRKSVKKLIETEVVWNGCN